MVALQQRVGSWSNVNWYEETTFDSDASITTGYRLPLSGPSSVLLAQNLLSVPVFKGDRRPFGKVLGPVTVSGKLPLNLEFLTFLRLLVVAMGRGNYTRPLGTTTGLHRVTIPTTAGAIPGSFQVENVFAEATQVVQRARACRAAAINFNLGTNGPALYDIDVIGIGDIASGTSTLFTPTDDGLVPTTYFNGQVNYKAQTAIVDLNSLALNLMMNVSRTEAFANSGIAASLPTGNVEPKGSIRVMLTTTGSNPGADLNAWNDAIAGTEVLIECFITNQPVNGSSGVFPTKYIRVKMPTCRMGAAAPLPGGMAGLFIQQPFEAARSVAQGTAAASIAAEQHNMPTAGPYNIGASTFNVGVKIDGGATITVALTQGAARTATQVVADLNANGPFAAVATADVFMGNYVRITSKQTGGVGAASSVQFDNTVVTNAHTVLGVNTTNLVVPGVTNCELYMEIFNNTQTATV